ncbi:hypothetical protein [Maribacter flavus]|uniref:Uncharacterized protein n=1 Tax=Maribacter flavus TaxID=1658664 RepID=A0A5B2TXR7_9FLAO|nr:hypothetical protein [Maribacter flavus]KAA2219361.1 hypothetical protein F0361_07080 [Maribacter flavus]
MISRLPVRQTYFLSFLFIFSVNISEIQAQEVYLPGYVVTLKGDTLIGNVSDRKMGPFGGIHAKIKFKGNGRKKRYSADNIQSYRKGDSIYRSFNLDGEDRFLRLEVEGVVSLDKFELQEQGEGMVMDIAYLKKRDNPTLVRADQGLLGLKRNLLIQFFSDCPPLADKIRSKEFKFPYQVVNFYNEWKAR